MPPDTVKNRLKCTASVPSGGNPSFSNNLGTLMATFQKRQGAWRAIVRKKGYPSQSKTFTTKAWAQKWARQVEDLIEAGHVGEGSIPTLEELFGWHLAHLDKISDRGRKTSPLPII